MLTSAVILIIAFSGVINAGFIPGYKRGMPSGYWYFKLHTVPKNWYEANLVCQSENAQLAVINSDEEANLYVDELAKYPAADVAHNFKPGGPGWDKDLTLLGFHDILNEGNFITIDGTPISDTGYVTWEVNQPDNAGNVENCGSMFRNGKLNDLPCNVPVMFFCETTFPYDDIEEIEPTNACETYENGYKLGPSIGDRFYKLHLEPKTWDEASLVCQLENARLAVINSQQEADLYVKELQMHPKDTIPGDFNKAVAMLGFHDRFNHGTYITFDGTNIKHTGYNHWSPGQPDNAGNNEHCGSIFTDGLLNDLPCNTNFMFFCEKPYINSSHLTSKGICLKPGQTLELSVEEITKGLECETYDLGYKKLHPSQQDEKYYKLHLNAKTWDDALLACQEEQATLAVIRSDEESKLFADILAKHPANAIPGNINKDVAIMGFHDRFCEGKFQTIDGKPLSNSGFYKWSPGQPDNNGNDENCGSIFRGGLLNDINCKTPYIFFCEKTKINTYIRTMSPCQQVQQ